MNNEQQAKKYVNVDGSCKICKTHIGTSIVHWMCHSKLELKSVK